MNNLIIIILSIISLSLNILGDTINSPIWSFECENNKCIKRRISNLNESISLPVCHMFCNENNNDLGILWPKPNGYIKINDILVHIDIKNVEFILPQSKQQEPLWQNNEKRFLKQINNKIPLNVTTKNGGRNIKIELKVNQADLIFNLATDESYKLLITNDNESNLLVTISGETFYGARHGLETLSQLIIYDNIRNEIQLPQNVEIDDKPAYNYRGIILDTGRNYFSIESIKRTIDAMAMVKLNTFHWHMIDSQSFPLVLKSQPELAKLGAYSHTQIYTPEDVLNVVNFARERGVRVLPEFDAPAHVGEGWQNKNMTSCFNAQPWSQFCVEPPCGQLDPTNNNLYNVLEDIYREMYEMFDYPDLFHMGGDEVSVSCWNTSKTIQDWITQKGLELEESSFMELWGHFQKNALERLDKVTNNKNLPIILWTSRLTEIPFVNKYLDKSRYIIQIWTLGNDPKITDLLEQGYKLIISNYDALYLDCGFGGWVNDGNNWCSPYIGWQKVYDNRPTLMGSIYRDQILGAEAALWSEQVDELTLDSRLWPRSSALAERLWSDPTHNWNMADSRMLMHRERLVQNGIGAESLQPQWCLLNQGDCPI